MIVRLDDEEKFVRFLYVMAAAAFLMPSLVRSEVKAGAPADKARVYVYRYKQYAGKALRPSIYVEDRDVARIQNGRYVILSLPTGKHSFRSNDKQSEIDLDLKGGQDYYIRIDIAMGLWKGHGRLTLVQPEQGAGEMKQMKPADSGMINDREYLVEDFEPAK